MSARNWLHVLALGLTLVLSGPALGQSQHEAQSADGDAEANQAPTQTLPIPLPVDIIEDEATAEAREGREAEARQREIEDLAAQQGMNSSTRAMNEATQDMRDYSLYSTMLVGAGTILLMVTLWLTRQANKAAQEAVDVTRDSAEKQLRAYVLLESIEVFNVAANNIPRVKITIRNTGATPASDFKHWATIGYQPYPMPPTAPDFDESIKSSYAVVAAGQSVEGEQVFSRKMSDQDIASISAGTCGLYVIGLIKYIDCFGKDRETRYCSFIGGPVGKRDFMAAYESGNSYT